MKVLIACEFSGTVRDAFIDKGHDAISCDFRDSEKDGPHYQGDVFDIIDHGWDLLIAHPPCTYLSRAGACRLYKKGGIIRDKERLKNGYDAKEFFMKLLNASIEKICIENPVPMKIFNLPPFTQIVQPYQFGHPYSKKTLLWLKGLPILLSTGIMANYEPFLPSNTSARARQGKSPKGTVRKKIDAQRTFLGIAEAMANQWG